MSNTFAKPGVFRVHPLQVLRERLVYQRGYHHRRQQHGEDEGGERPCRGGHCRHREDHEGEMRHTLLSQIIAGLINFCLQGSCCLRISLLWLSLTVVQKFKKIWHIYDMQNCALSTSCDPYFAKQRKKYYFNTPLVIFFFFQKLLSTLELYRPRRLNVACLLRKRTPLSSGYIPNYLGFEVTRKSVLIFRNLHYNWMNSFLAQSTVPYIIAQHTSTKTTGTGPAL